MTSPCRWLTNFFNPFAPKSNKRKLGDSEASSQRVQNTVIPILTPDNGTGHFQRIGPQVVSYIGSFLADRDVVFFSNTNKALREQLDKILEIKQRSIFSSILIFDKKKYKDYWGVEITDEFEPEKIDKRILRRFLKTYFGPNPVHPEKLVKDTCFIPFVEPVRVTVGGRSFDYNLNLLSDIASHPGIGSAATIVAFNDSAVEESGPALEEFEKILSLIGETSPQQACIKIVLRAVVGLFEDWERQVERLRDLNEETGYGCETEPDALSLATAALAEHAVGGKPVFMEASCFTDFHTRELVLWQHLEYGYKYSYTVGGFVPSGWTPTINPMKLSVGPDRRCASTSTGIAIYWTCGLSEVEP